MSKRSAKELAQMNSARVAAEKNAIKAVAKFKAADKAVKTSSEKAKEAAESLTPIAVALGKFLIIIKKNQLHGEYQKFLDRHSIDRNRANYCTRLAVAPKTQKSAQEQKRKEALAEMRRFISGAIQMMSEYGKHSDKAAAEEFVHKMEQILWAVYNGALPKDALPFEHQKAGSFSMSFPTEKPKADAAHSGA
jgi:hypothetical protein